MSSSSPLSTPKVLLEKNEMQMEKSQKRKNQSMFALSFEFH
jgi:hypothetical protein